MTERGSSCQINLNTGGMSQDEREKKRDKFYCTCVEEIILSIYLFLRFQFRRAFSVHFYGQITSNYKTGEQTAYDFLGPKYCPNIYSVENNLDGDF